MFSDGLAVTAGDHAHATASEVTWRKRQPRCHEVMWFDPHVRRILMPTHISRRLRVFDKQHTSPERYVCTNQIFHRANDSWVMDQFVEER